MTPIRPRVPRMSLWDARWALLHPMVYDEARAYWLMLRSVRTGLLQ